MQLFFIALCLPALAAAQKPKTAGKIPGSASGQQQTLSPMSANTGSKLITGKYQIEGKVTMPKEGPAVLVPKNWQSYTRILANYGEHVGFVREDGGFVINNVPPGSYIVEVANKDYIFEPFRVDITSKGKIRARKFNILQPGSVHSVQYPLRFTARQPASYFRKREQWRITDFLFSPMVLMMVLPFLLIMVLPKLINTDDPEIQREMQQSMQMPKYDMPEISEVMANWFGGGKKKPTKSTKPKIRS